MGMNKGKLKREKKELERLFNQGRYGEFLRLVEREGVTAAFPGETDKAWRELADAAFATPDGMTDYFRLRRLLTMAPELPDLSFLHLLERFLQGEDSAVQVAELKNLSPPAQAMARQLLQWDDTQEIFPELESLFRQFASSPEETTSEQMAEAARIFMELFGGSVEFLATAHEILGSFKRSDSVAGKSEDLNLLSHLDQTLEEMLQALPAGIGNIFLAPLLRRLSRLYEVYCGEEPPFALELAGVTPYLSSHLTGDRWGEVAELLNEDDLTERYGDDPRYLRQRIAVAPFSEKVRYLGKLAAILTEEARKRDDPDHPAPELEQHIRADYLFLYLDVLAEIGRNRSQLSLGEQGELVQVMGGELDRAFVHFVSAPRECDEFLQGVALAGLLDTKLALASLLLARTTGNRTLRETAERALTLLPPAVKGDIHWLFKYFGFLSYPSLSAFAPVIRQLRNQETLLQLLADLVAIQVTRALVSNQLINFSRLPLFQAMKKGAPRDTKQEMAEFRDELRDYFDITAFNHLFILAENYPEGYITEVGFRKVLATQYAGSGMVEVIRRMKLLPPPPPGMTVMDPQRSTLFGMELRVSLELMKQHFDDLRSVPLESMKTLVEILERCGPRTVEMGFLAGLSALLQKRRAAGEEEAALLVSRLQALIRV